jgi:hypothetical protein
MCKEVPVIPFNRVVDKKIIIAKITAKEEERHKGKVRGLESRQGVRF